MNHDIKGCKNVGSKLPICPRREIVLEIWLTSLLPTYWAPPFYSISNKSLYKLHNSAQIGPKLPIFPKIYFPGKLTITFVCLLCSILQQRFKKKKPQRANHQTRLHNSGPNWAWPCPPKGNLLEKLTNIELVFYIPSCYFQKNPEQADHKVA